MIRFVLALTESVKPLEEATQADDAEEGELNEETANETTIDSKTDEEGKEAGQQEDGQVEEEEEKEDDDDDDNNKKAEKNERDEDRGDRKK